MYPYQLSKVLADQRIRDRVADADRRRLIATGRTRNTATSGPSTRLKYLIARVAAPFIGRGRATAHVTATFARTGAPTMASGSAAGPIGCST